MNGAARTKSVNRWLAMFGLGMLCALLAVHVGLCLTGSHGHGSEPADGGYSVVAADAETVTTVGGAGRSGGEHPHENAAGCCDQAALRGPGSLPMLGELLALLALVCMKLLWPGGRARPAPTAWPPPERHIPPTVRCLSVLLCVSRT